MRRRTLALLAIVALAGCAAPPSKTASTVATPTVPTATPTADPVHVETKSSGDREITVVQRVAIRGSRQTRTAYELRALSSQADIVGDESVVGFEQPHVTFHDRTGKTLIADSPEAKITQRDKNVVMTGGVHARAQDGSVLTCDTLRYDGRTEKLHGVGHVVMTGPNDLTLTGRYLAGDIRLDDVRVSQQPL